MTDREAFKEARRRWGRRAIIIHFSQRLPRWAKPYSVGLRKNLLENEVLGSGMDWEEALREADQTYLHFLKKPAFTCRQHTSRCTRSGTCSCSLLLDVPSIPCRCAVLHFAAGRPGDQRLLPLP